MADRSGLRGRVAAAGLLALVAAGAPGAGADTTIVGHDDVPFVAATAGSVIVGHEDVPYVAASTGGPEGATAAVGDEDVVAQGIIITIEDMPGVAVAGPEEARGIIIIIEDIPMVAAAGPAGVIAIVGHDDQPFVAGNGRRTAVDQEGVRIASASASTDRAATSAIVVEDDRVAIGRAKARADADGDRRSSTSGILVDAGEVVIERATARADADGDGRASSMSIQVGDAGVSIQRSSARLDSDGDAKVRASTITVSDGGTSVVRRTEG
jgi:hypothetical protein